MCVGVVNPPITTMFSQGAINAHLGCMRFRDSADCWWVSHRLSYYTKESGRVCTSTVWRLGRSRQVTGVGEGAGAVGATRCTRFPFLPELLHQLPDIV